MSGSLYVEYAFRGNPTGAEAYKATLEAAAIAAGVGFAFQPAVGQLPKVPAGIGGGASFYTILPASFVLPEVPNGVVMLTGTAARALLAPLQ